MVVKHFFYLQTKRKNIFHCQKNIAVISRKLEHLKILVGQSWLKPSANNTKVILCLTNWGVEALLAKSKFKTHRKVKSLSLFGRWQPPPCHTIHRQIECAVVDTCQKHRIHSYQKWRHRQGLRPSEFYESTTDRWSMIIGYGSWHLGEMHYCFWKFWKTRSDVISSHRIMV